jgi:hypothetical protein
VTLGLKSSSWRRFFIGSHSLPPSLVRCFGPSPRTCHYAKVIDTNPNVHGMCKTPDFHRKSESLYHPDSPWISVYRVQNVSQINTQSHTSHHIKVIVHEFITSPLWSTTIQASWLNQSENSTQRYLSSQKGLHLYSSATGKLERSDVSLIRTIRRRCSRTRTRTCTPKVYPQGVG